MENAGQSAPRKRAARKRRQKEPPLPRPPVRSNVNLHGFAFMPLDSTWLAGSETWAIACAHPFAAAACINLWLKAWHQVPAGSLPDNDAMHRMWSGVSTWDDVRTIALRGFIKCSDGRLYHFRLCEKVREAWHERQRYRKAAKLRWKKKKTNGASDTPTHDPTHDPSHAQRTVRRIENAHASEGTGTGTGTGIKKKKKKAPADFEGKTESERVDEHLRQAGLNPEEIP